MRPRRVRFPNGATNLYSVRLYTAQYELLLFDICSLTLWPTYGRGFMRKHGMKLFRHLTIALTTLLVLSGCGYNSLQGLDEQVKGAWAEVQNQYQRRADLIPNLVATVKG